MMALNYEQACAFLKRDGGVVPCSRYGRNSEECAPWAYALCLVAADANGDPINEETLDYAMGLVVNDHDDVANLVYDSRHAVPASVRRDLGGMRHVRALVTNAEGGE